jgi:ubiquitin-like-specific protease 1C/D
MIYYPSRDDPEAVELSSSDIKCLDPGVYLSSPVINFYIQYMKRTKLHDDDCREKFYIFNTYFYSKLEEALLGKVLLCAMNTMFSADCVSFLDAKREG